MIKEINQNFIKESGQEMYFDKEIAEEMIEREENISHDTVSKIFEAILLTEFRSKDKLMIADLGAGAHSMDYVNFIKFLKYNKGKIYWVDQSLFMLDYAKRNTPEEFKEVFDFRKEEMMNFLKEEENKLDGIIFKYSFTYIIPCSLEKMLQIVYKKLKKDGKVFANLHFYEKEGMKERSYNAIYKIKGKKVVPEYKPKDNEIIEIEFLKKGGDKTDDPEVFAKTKIIYYSSRYIRESARKAKFSEIRIFNDWQENKKWGELFKQLNPNMEARPNAFLYLKK
jgi:ubiquinone/menaquinone biosynthesis C-methylase UbiE